MATEKQIEANRQNAQRSTGPKTDEGKTHSRGNALKHGLAGTGVVAEREDDGAFQEKLKAYLDHVAPGDALEEDLIKNMAWASVKLERARRQELAEVAARKREARRKWEEQRHKEVEELV